jgi:predicted RNA-binding Zn ribbon-like protein
METPAPFRGQRIVGGNLAVDFLNTQNGPAGEPPEEDVLQTYADLVAWSAHLGSLADPEQARLSARARRRPAEARAVLERAHATRDYLYRILDTVARGGHPADADLARLQRDEAEALSHGRLVPSGGEYAWSWAADRSLGRPLWPIIHAALSLVTTGPLDRVKGCASCRFHFVDESKNRSRRWCSMDDCGAEDKMRKYVARRAAARGAARGAHRARQR